MHTDICTPYATRPTWSNLTVNDQQQLMTAGLPAWEKLVQNLNPDIIIASLPQHIITQLGISGSKKVLTIIKHTDKGAKRKRQFEVEEYNYRGIRFINGKTFNVPFGSISHKQKEQVGSLI